MDEEVVQIKARFSGLTDEELRRILTTERAEYRRVALDLAAAELMRRGASVPVVAPPERPPRMDDTEPAGRSFFTREWLLSNVPGLLTLLAAWATSSVVEGLWNPGSYALHMLLFISCWAIYLAILNAAWKQFFPESYEMTRATETQAGEDVAASDRLKAELRDAAQDARDRMGLKWEARDIYFDSYGYHIDFYDEAGRLHAAVFESPRPPERGWSAEAVARRLREMADEPKRLPPVNVGGFSHYE